MCREQNVFVLHELEAWPCTINQYITTLLVKTIAWNDETVWLNIDLCHFHVYYWHHTNLRRKVSRQYQTVPERYHLQRLKLCNSNHLKEILASVLYKLAQENNKAKFNMISRLPTLRSLKNNSNIFLFSSDNFCIEGDWNLWLEGYILHITTLAYRRHQIMVKIMNLYFGTFFLTLMITSWQAW